MKDLKTFHSAFYSNCNKISQDAFIVKFCNVSTIKRIRNPDANRKRDMAISYSIRKENKSIIPVCKNAFLQALGLSKHRVEGVMKRFLNSGEAPKETRGGDHTSNSYFNKKQSVIGFIKNIVVIEKHYCRGRSARQYIASDLSICKLWKLYNASVDNFTLRVKESYFRHIFNTKFNIGFNSPHTDVCSKCLELSSKIKHEKNMETKTSLVTERNIHKQRAKAFFDLLKEERQDLITLSYDCEKNLVLPKVPDQICYYKRQLYLYNFTVVKGSSKQKLKTDNVFIHTWLETDRPKSANEISSAVYDTLSNLTIEDSVSEIRLMSDGCGGQNKNICMISMCIKWFASAPRNIKKLQLIFPITGHSFIPPDRVFGKIEKVLKKQDTIISPDYYYDTFQETGIVKKLGTDWVAYDWKESCQRILKSTSSLHFKINSCKRIILTKNAKGVVQVQGEPNYRNDFNVSKSIFKQGMTVAMIDPVTLEIGKVRLKPQKTVDINELLIKHFGNEWKQERDNLNLTFYKNILDTQNSDNNLEEHNAGSEHVCEPVDNNEYYI